MTIRPHGTCRIIRMSDVARTATTEWTYRVGRDVPTTDIAGGISCRLGSVGRSHLDIDDGRLRAVDEAGELRQGCGLSAPPAGCVEWWQRSAARQSCGNARKAQLFTSVRS